MSSSPADLLQVMRNTTKAAIAAEVERLHAVMELGTALGVSTDSAKRYVGAALEIRYRLPRLWERVAAGDLPFWKARTIAESTMCLPEAGALFVDARVAFCAHKIGYAARSTRPS